MLADASAVSTSQVAPTKPAERTGRVTPGAAREGLRPSIALRRIAVGLILIAVGRVHEIIPPLTGSLPLVKLLILGGIAALVSRRDSGRRLRHLGSTHGGLLLLFLTAIVTSIPFSVYKSASLTKAIEVLPPSIAIVLVIVASVSSAKDLDLLFTALTGAVGALGLAMLAGLGYVMMDGGMPRRAITMMYDPNDLALVGAVAVPLALLLATRRDMVQRIVGLTGTFGALTLVMLTGSRGGFLALALAMLPMLLSSRSPISKRIRMLIIFGLLGSVPFLPETFSARVESLFALEDDYNMTSETGRVELAKRGFAHFVENPVAGVGFGQFSVAEGLWARANGREGGFRWADAHNMYVQAAAELGVPGIFALVGILLFNVHLASIAARLLRRGVIDDAQAERAFAIRSSTLALMLGGTFLSAAYSPIVVLTGALGVAYGSTLPQATRRKAAR